MILGMLSRSLNVGITTAAFCGETGEAASGPWSVKQNLREIAFFVVHQSCQWHFSQCRPLVNSSGTASHARLPTRWPHVDGLWLSGINTCVMGLQVAEG